MDKQSEFLSSFPTIYCGKTRVDNHLIIFSTTFPRVLSMEDSNYSSTFQHVNRTFSVIFDSFKSHCLTNASINKM